MEWTITDKDQKLSKIAEKAIHEGPQRIIREQGSVVVISEDAYRLLNKDASMKNDFLEFLMSGPGLEDLDLERDRSPMREFEW